MRMSRINELKIKINELNQKIKDTTETMDKLLDKEERIRKTLVTNICISGVGYMILGPLIHPAISLASVFFLAGNVIPGGILILRSESKTDNLQREIDISKRELYDAEKELVAIHREPLSVLPTFNEPVNQTIVEPTQTTKKDNINKKSR